MILPSGTELGTYRIDRLLGRGGMGEVYLATDLALDRPVALKVLPDALAADDAFRSRFLAESKLAASLDHAHIVPVYDAGERDGRLVIAMRYVDGEDLSVVVSRDGPLEPERAVALLDGIADALDAAHARGLIHRDVKPSNILVTRTARSGEHAYLADFGLSRQLGSSLDFTRGGFVGSVGYVAPERIEGRSVDGRGDIYALACVLVELLTGRAPFTRDDDLATLWAHIHAPRPVPSETDRRLAPFDPVVARGMAVDPNDRYQTAGALLADAARAASQGSSGGQEAVETVTAVSAPGVSARTSNRGRLLMASVVGVSALVLAGAALMNLRPGTPGSTPSPEASSGPIVDASTSEVPSGGPSVVVIPTFGPDQYEPVLLDPGVIYRFATFRPNIELSPTVAGWQVSREYADGWQMEYRPVSNEPTIGILAAGYVQVVFEEPCIDGATRTLQSGVTAVTDWLETHELLTTSEPRPAVVGGFRGVSLDIALADPAMPSDCQRPEGMPDQAWEHYQRRVFLFPLNQDDYWIAQGETVRVTVIDVEGQSVTLLGGTSDDDDFETFRAPLDGILNSMRFDP